MYTLAETGGGGVRVPLVPPSYAPENVLEKCEILFFPAFFYWVFTQAHLYYNIQGSLGKIVQNCAQVVFLARNLLSEVTYARKA